MTESGRSKEPGRRSSSSKSMPAETANRARSPTTLLEGVTLTRLPSRSVGSLVGAFDLFEAAREAYGVGLLAQVGELAARDLVAVDAPGRRLQAGLERAVECAHRLPIRLLVQERVERDARVALGRRGGGDDRRQGGLAGHPGHRGGGAVDGVDAGVDGGEVGRELPAGGVVGVQVNGQLELAAQRGHEGAGGRGAQQAGHVLDGQHVYAGVDQLLGEAQVVGEGVELLARVAQVARVAQGSLGECGCLERCLDRGAHAFDVVERVEDAEDVDAGLDRLGDERAHDLGGKARVGEEVLAAQRASAGRRWGPVRAAARAGPMGPRAGSAARRRRSRRPTPPARAAAVARARGAVPTASMS